MNEIVQAAIAADIASLERVVQVQTGPLGYGVDLSCVGDISDTLDEVDAFSPKAIGEALLRRLTTPRGALQDDPDYGLDIRGMLNRGTTVSDLSALQGRIRMEVTKDDRVSGAAVTVVMPAYDELRIAVRVTPENSDQSFTLTYTMVDGQLSLESF